MPIKMPKPAQTPSGRRLLTMLSVALALGVPAGVLRAGCVGDTCRDRSAGASADTPFCSLPSPTRAAVAAGYRKGRSPDVMGVTADPGLTGPVEPESRSNGETLVAWPSLDLEPEQEVAIALGGAGVAPGSSVPGGATLADIAPTIAEVIGLERPHPEVRTGSGWPDVAAGEPPSLVGEIVWKGPFGGPRALGVPDFEKVAGRGVGGAVAAGSLPLDPAALMATLGSGAVPSEHGITGTYIRSEDGSAVEAWTDRSPGSVVAMLADDLNEITNRSRASVIGDAPADIGLVGSDWYLTGDRNAVFIGPNSTPARQAARAARLLKQKEKRVRQEDVTDLVAITLDGSLDEMEDATRDIIEAGDKVAPGDVLYVLVSLPTAGTSEGSSSMSSEVIADTIESEVRAPVIESVAVGGFFLNQEILARENMSEDAILAVMEKMKTPGGEDLFADRFSGVAVSFARYC